MTNLINYKDFIEKINRIVNKTTFEEIESDIELMLDLPAQYVPQWSEYIGKELTKGSLVNHLGVKYLVIQTLTPIESQTPDSVGMLAVYKPYQGKYGYQWVYGEYSEVGFTRYFEGKLYEAIQGPNANIYSPDLVSAIWVEV
ncbi:MAG: hypothetical protein R3Y50_10145 [Rikenellaceae bacterium]